MPTAAVIVLYYPDYWHITSKPMDGSHLSVGLETIQKVLYQIRFTYKRISKIDFGSLLFVNL